MPPRPLPLLQGTLELLILEALRSRQPLHGFEILRWIYDKSGSVLTIEEGSLYPALHRMEDRKWITSEWGVSERGRRAKYYRIAPAGRKQLVQEERTWLAYVDAVSRLLLAAQVTPA
jgi:PadR family transcriptional regulator PadR